MDQPHPLVEDTEQTAPQSASPSSQTRENTPEPIADSREDLLLNGIVRQMLRTSFPTPADKGLQGPFRGHDATTYLERFDRAFQDYGTGREADKVSWFEQWCDEDLWEVILDWPQGTRGSWTTFSATVKERWQWADNKRGAIKELDKVLETTCEPTAQEIYNHLEKVEVLLTRVPKKESAKANAVDKIWERLPGSFKVGCRPYQDFTEEVDGLDWPDFRNFIQKCLYNGVNAGAVFYKLEPRSTKAQEARTSLQTIRHAKNPAPNLTPSDQRARPFVKLPLSQGVSVEGQHRVRERSIHHSQHRGYPLGPVPIRVPPWDETRLILGGWRASGRPSQGRG